MRRLFVLLLVTLVAAASLAWLVRLDAGYVLVQYQGTRIETTVWVAAVLGIIGLLAFYYGARLLLRGADALARLAGRRPANRPLMWRRGDATARGLLAFLEGRWAVAARLLPRAARSSPLPLLNYLLSARAAAALGDTELAEGFLALAEEVPGAAESVRCERARMASARGEHALALAAMDAPAAAQSPAMTALLLEILPRTGDWARLAALVPQARQQRAAAETVIDELEERSFAALLGTAGTSLAAARQAWAALPARLRQRGTLVAAHARLLAGAGAAAEAQELLENALARGWDPALVRALGLCAGAEPARQLSRAEALLARHPGDAELLLALGRLALANRLWGKARDYLEASLARVARADTCAELARLCERLGDTDRARELRERALAMTIGQLPALPLPGTGV